MSRNCLFTLCFCCLLLRGAPSKAQSIRVGAPDVIPVGELSEMENMLGQAGAAQKVDLLTRLGIDPEIGKIVTEELLPGQKIALQPLRSRGSARYGAAFLPSFRACYLYLLEAGGDAHGRPGWHVSGEENVSCWDGAASLEIMPLHMPGQDDLILHHVNLGHGTGLLVDATQVFSFGEEGFQKILETEDRRFEETIDTGDTLEQASTFMKFPDGSYEETRSSTENNVLKRVERRSWRWSGNEHRFVATAFRLASTPQQ